MEQYQYGIGLLGLVLVLVVLVLLRPYYKWYWDSSSFRYYNAFLQRHSHHIQVVSINWNKLVIIELILYQLIRYLEVKETQSDWVPVGPVTQSDRYPVRLVPSPTVLVHLYPILIILTSFNICWFDIIEKNEWYTLFENRTHDIISGYLEQCSNHWTIEARLTHHSLL